MLALLLAGFARELFTGAIANVNDHYKESGRSYHIELNQSEIYPKKESSLMKPAKSTGVESR